MLPQLYTCIILSSDNPSHITRGFTRYEPDIVNRFLKEDEAKAKNQRNKSNYGLNMLQLNPKHLGGFALFEYQIAFRQWEIAAKDHKLSDHLYIEFQDRHQEDPLAPDVASSI